MKFQFLAAFRKREGDEDSLSKYLRMLRAACASAVCGSLWLMLSASGAVYGSESPDAGLGSVLYISIVVLLFLGSYKAGEFLSGIIANSGDGQSSFGGRKNSGSSANWMI